MAESPGGADFRRRGRTHTGHAVIELTWFILPPKIRNRARALADETGSYS
jgi:hypothetical protein